MDKRKKFRVNYGPWALIAGGTEGLGREFSLLAAEQGLNVAVVGRREGPLEAAAREIQNRFGVEVLPVKADLGAPDADLELDRTLGDREVGLLIYNACTSVIGPFTEMRREDHLSVVDVNCRGPVLLARRFGKKMCSRGRGGILLMSSMSGLQGAPLVACYAASKAFNLTLAQSLWEEFRHFHVDVTACVAGVIRTPNYLTSLPRGGVSSAPEMEAREVAEIALRNLGKKSYVIPGFANRVAVFFLQHVLGKRRVVKLVARNMYKLYRPKQTERGTGN
jgi:uncharacterized protein